MTTFGSMNYFEGLMMKKLNFGSGTDIIEGWDNADLDNHNGANICFDFNKFPYPIKSNTYDYILANHVMEHLEKPEEAIYELARSCKDNGVIEINVPHMNCEGAFALGHINYWTTWSFKLLANPVGWEKKRDIRLELISLKEVPSRFGKWIYPRWLRRKLSLLVRGIQEEIHVILKVIK